jgi:AmmeMemoRadiSam system protein B
MFYPADPRELESDIRSYLDAAETNPESAPKAIVAPHAGYIYSGPIAGSAYAQLRTRSKRIEQVILLGPSHRVPFRGLAYSEAGEFLTPLGSVPVDRSAYEAVADLPQARPFEAPFEGEHCLEVQLPFLQLVLDAFRIVPFLVGDTSTDEAAEVIARLWGGDETLIVISSDLSHYLDYDSARRIDAATSKAIEGLHPEDIGYDQACGRNPLNGLLREVRNHGLHGRTLDLRNSGDTAGPRDRVVGYGAYAFS